MDKQKNDEIAKPTQSTNDDENTTSTRRHGEVLENAILKAAIDELNRVGYARLTMEGVALLAKTNKAAVYRRWPNKASLVIAALHKHVLSPTIVPDTGNLRDDLLIFLKEILKPLQTIGAETMHGLMVDHLGKNLMSLNPEIIHPGAEDRLETGMKKILKNAELRGEINLEKINPRIISLPVDLIRYKILTTHEPIPDEIISEIVDDIFMPLVGV
jgi:hypothetical protein